MSRASSGDAERYGGRVGAVKALAYKLFKCIRREAGRA
jgi:hypothetical protein